MKTGTPLRSAGTATLLACCALLVESAAAHAADVTYQRLLHPEPQN